MNIYLLRDEKYAASVTPLKLDRNKAYQIPAYLLHNDPGSGDVGNYKRETNDYWRGVAKGMNAYLRKANDNITILPGTEDRRQGKISDAILTAEQAHDIGVHLADRDVSLRDEIGMFLKERESVLHTLETSLFILKLDSNDESPVKTAERLLAQYEDLSKKLQLIVDHARSRQGLMRGA